VKRESPSTDHDICCGSVVRFAIPLLISPTDDKTKRDPEAMTMRGDALMKRGRYNDKEEGEKRGDDDKRARQ